MAKSIIEFKKTINKSFNYIVKTEKAIAKIAGFFSNKHTNKN